MKTKAIIVLVYFVFLSFSAGAQNENKPIVNDTSRNEICVGYGVLTHLAAFPLKTKKKQSKNSYFHPIIAHYLHLEFASG